MADERSDIETLPASDDVEEQTTDESDSSVESDAPGEPVEEAADQAADGVPSDEESAAEASAEDEEASGATAQEPEADDAREPEAGATDSADVSDPQAEISGSEDPERTARSVLGLGEKVEEEGMKPEEAAAILEAAAAKEEEEAEEEPEAEAPDLEDADLVDVVEEEPSEPSPYDRPGDWYVVHTYSGYEKKVKSNLESRVKSLNMEGRINEVVIPMDDVIEFKGGKKTVVQKKVFPGYLLVRMALDDNSWGAVRNTPGVTGFVGSGAKPTPLSRKEVESILRVRPEDETKKARPRLEFEVGDQVRVTAGPFADFNGLIDEINVDQSTLKVLVNIFGRETPVTLEFSDVAKL